MQKDVGELIRRLSARRQPVPVEKSAPRWKRENPEAYASWNALGREDLLDWIAGGPNGNPLPRPSAEVVVEVIEERARRAGDLRRILVELSALSKDVESGLTERDFFAVTQLVRRWGEEAILLCVGHNVASEED